MPARGWVSVAPAYVLARYRPGSARVDHCQGRFPPSRPFDEASFSERRAVRKAALRGVRDDEQATPAVHPRSLNDALVTASAMASALGPREGGGPPQGQQRFYTTRGTRPRERLMPKTAVGTAQP